MVDLSLDIEGAEPERYAAAPLLLFKLRIIEAGAPAASAVPIHTIALHCQVRIEPSRRHYDAAQRRKLRDLFGTEERWGQTLRPFLWTHIDVAVPAFEGATRVALPVACTYDFSLAATKYFDALEDGDIPLCFLFSGTIFYEAETGGLQMMRIPWEKEARYRLPASTWKTLMDLYYPNSAWLGLRRDVFQRLLEFRTGEGIASWEQTIERLLATADSPRGASNRKAEEKVVS